MATQAWLTASTLYLLVLLVLARAARPSRPMTRASGRPLRFVTLVPAHDEADGIGVTLGALAEQDHPRALHETIVIADNCTDDTAAVAAAAGATVWSRVDEDARGKGQALAWALERLWVERPDVEAVAMVDADCRCSPNFLSACDARLRAGARAVQADYVVENPDASTSAALRYAGFALMHAVRLAGKERAGLSVGLLGTGMAFAADLLRELPWASFSITEDIEYHVQLVEAGERVRYVGEAAVASPMPTTHAAAREQQLRWESGNANVVRGSVARLLASGMERGDLQRIHTAGERLVPPQTLLLAGNAAISAAAVALRSRALVALGAATALGQAAYVVGGLHVAQAPPEVMRALRAAPSLIVAKLPLFGRIAAGRGAKRWVRTTRG